MRRRALTLPSAWIPLLWLALAAPPAPAAEEISLDLEDVPLFEAVRAVEAAAGVEIVLGENRDGSPLDGDPVPRVTIRFTRVRWPTALKLVAEIAGARAEPLADGRWRVFQPPRYVLVLADADLSAVVLMVARLGDLDVVFAPEVVRGRTVTLRLRDLPWKKVLEVVVQAAGLALVAEGPDARTRVALPDEGAAKASRPEGGAPGAETKPRLRVTAVLVRTDGGTSRAVVGGVLVEEGAVVRPGCILPDGTEVRPLVLGKVMEDGVVLRQGPLRIVQKLE